MYPRKILLGKKKSKITSKGAKGDWGPRIALIEREQQQLDQLDECEPNKNCKRRGSDIKIGKPLSLIIPEKYEFNPILESLPSTETWRSTSSDDESSPTLQRSMKLKDRENNEKYSKLLTVESQVHPEPPKNISCEKRAGNFNSQTITTILYVPRNNGDDGPDYEKVNEDEILCKNSSSSSSSGSCKSILPRDDLSSFDSNLFIPKQQIPPPLPPKNKSPPAISGKKKSLRFSDTVPEEIQNLPVDITKKIQGENVLKIPELKKNKNRKNSPCENNPQFSDWIAEEGILSCGHVRDYSTLSSINSQMSQGNEKESKEARSALEQLRELSALIGGNFEQERNSCEESSCGDSGKSSGSGILKTEKTNKAKDRDRSGNGETPGRDIFKVDCEECLSFFKNPFGNPERFNGVVGTLLTSDLGSSCATSSLNTSGNHGLFLSDKREEEKNKDILTKLKKAGEPRNKSSLINEPKSCDAKVQLKFKKPSENSTTNSNSSKSFILHPQLPSNPPPAEIGFVKNSKVVKKKKRVEMHKLSPVGSNESSGLFTIEEEGERTWEPKSLLAAETAGWSDLESLYSNKIKEGGKVQNECATCWKELSAMKANSFSNLTVDRTKRMFIWLNKRHQEFNAPWWDAKKQASLRWLVTKASSQPHDPFKSSSGDRSEMSEEVMKGLVSGSLYISALAKLYGKEEEAASHWDIIKILSRRGVYVAQPSDMKLTEGTLRQKRPIRIAAHIALIEALISLYAKEILRAERVLATLNSLGFTIDVQEKSTYEKLAIAWVNAALLTVKSYVLATMPNKMTPELLSRWSHIGKAEEIRDLCDGVGLCAILSLYFSTELAIEEIAVPEPGETLSIFETISNLSLVHKIADSVIPEKITHLCVSDFIYIHGHMKNNVLAFLVDLFAHCEINPVNRVNRLTNNNSQILL